MELGGNSVDVFTVSAVEIPTTSSMPAIMPETSSFTYCAELAGKGFAGRNFHGR
jgi:hypothetical protein